MEINHTHEEKKIIKCINKETREERGQYNTKTGKDLFSLSEMPPIVQWVIIILITAGLIGIVYLMHK